MLTIGASIGVSEGSLFPDDFSSGTLLVTALAALVIGRWGISHSSDD